MTAWPPIGIFHASAKFPYEARRQASDDLRLSHGAIHLQSGCGYEQALEDLAGFERIWIIYHFHLNHAWKPKVLPPRGPAGVKRGVFATRAPYRPNPLGLSCVRLRAIEGLRVLVEGHDLLDGTPVLDIKPYIPYADAFPEAQVGWLENIEARRWRVEFSKGAQAQLQWLEDRGLSQLRGFITSQLEFEPIDEKRKRITSKAEDYRLAYRTWRIDFALDLTARVVRVKDLASGYQPAELQEPADPYGDKDLHRSFLAQRALI